MNLKAATVAIFNDGMNLKPITHGMSNTKIYKIWKQMNQRCNNKNNRYYFRYGGRGIKVCKRWRKFENFFKDMGKKPDGLSLDRIDNNGNYEPSNCRWATLEIQRNNCSGNHFISYNDETRTLSKWAEAYGINVSTLYQRLQRGWPIEHALSNKKWTHITSRRNGAA